MTHFLLQWWCTMWTLPWCCCYWLCVMMCFLGNTLVYNSWINLQPFCLNTYEYWCVLYWCKINVFDKLNVCSWAPKVMYNWSVVLNPESYVLVIRQNSIVVFDYLVHIGNWFTQTWSLQQLIHIGLLWEMIHPKFQMILLILPGKKCKSMSIQIMLPD